MTTTQSKVPAQLKAGIAALMIAMGGGYAAYTTIDRDTTALLRNQYVQAVAADKGTSEAVKVAMVMGAYYESSYKHIGTPYVDKLMNLPDASFACGFLRVFGGHVDAVS